MTNNSELTLKAARYALVNQPYFMLCEIKRGMMDSYHKVYPTVICCSV